MNWPGLRVIEEWMWAGYMDEYDNKISYEMVEDVAGFETMR